MRSETSKDTLIITEEQESRRGAEGDSPEEGIPLQMREGVNMFEHRGNLHVDGVFEIISGGVMRDWRLLVEREIVCLVQIKYYSFTSRITTESGIFEVSISQTEAAEAAHKMC